MTQLPAAATQTRERTGLGTMANFTTQETLRRLFTIPYMTFTTTDGHKVRKALLKNDLDQAISIAQRRKGRGHWTFDSQHNAIGAEEVVNIITRNLIGKVTKVHNGRLLRISSDRDVLGRYLQIYSGHRRTLPPRRNWTHLRPSGLTISSNCGSRAQRHRSSGRLQTGSGA